METWQVFSTNLRRPTWSLAECINSWHPYYDHMFCWINGSPWHNVVMEQTLERRCTGILRTRMSHRTRPGGYKLRETPLSVGYAIREFSDIEDIPEPDVIMQFDDDEQTPAHPDFPNYYENWLESDSRLMNCNWVYMWDDTYMRVDRFASQSSHGFFFKPEPGKRFSWMPYGGGGRPEALPRKCGWECPYPVRHYSHAGETARLVYVEDEKTGRQIGRPDHNRSFHYQVHPRRIVRMVWYPKVTMDDIHRIQCDIAKRNIPNCCEEVIA